MQLLVSATHKSSGKTVFCIGLLAALRRRGVTVQPFKKGPDYIDPHWLALAAGRPCYNLDFYIQTSAEMEAFFNLRKQGAFALVEANKGLYDGLSLSGNDSNAALAKHLQLPVLLVLDCVGTTRGVAPLLQGYLNFSSQVEIVGVVLNKVGGSRHQSKLEAMIRNYVGIPILGAIMRDTRMELPERHLGLLPGNEAEDAERVIERMGAVIGEQVDCDKVSRLSFHLDRKRPEPVTKDREEVISALPAAQRFSILPHSYFRLGIFRDRAFNFYYADDLEALQKEGGELIFINSLDDTELPPLLDGLLIGGGFPETQARALQANCSLRKQVKQAIEAGLPTYAECGGLMYLTKSITWQGRGYEMAGVLQADTVMCDTPQGRGYTRAYETDSMPWGTVPETECKLIFGHEFHYSEIVGLPASVPMAFDMLRGGGIVGGKDGIVYKNLLATYMHQRSSMGNPWTRRFAGFILARRSANGGSQG